MNRELRRKADKKLKTKKKVNKIASDEVAKFVNDFDNPDCYYVDDENDTEYICWENFSTYTEDDSYIPSYDELIKKFRGYPHFNELIAKATWRAFPDILREAALGGVDIYMRHRIKIGKKIKLNGFLHHIIQDILTTYDEMVHYSTIEKIIMNYSPIENIRLNPNKKKL